jgi:hypothetical protein
MTRGVWAGLVACAVGVGCSGPQFYDPPPTQMPAERDVGGVHVRFIDQRPEWEKKPFTGTVCLYHADKAHPGLWTQLDEETNAVIAAMPQKPERVEVEVASLRLVRVVVDPGTKFRDYGPPPNANPSARNYPTPSDRDPTDLRNRQVTQGGGNTGVPPARPPGDAPANKVEMAFAAKDDPRRMLSDHPTGASCAIQAKVRLVFPGGREQTVDVKTIVRGENTTGTAYQGEAMDSAARIAVFQFGRQFRAGVGLSE